VTPACCSDGCRLQTPKGPPPSVCATHRSPRRRRTTSSPMSPPVLFAPAGRFRSLPESANNGNIYICSGKPNSLTCSPSSASTTGEPKPFLFRVHPIRYIRTASSPPSPPVLFAPACLSPSSTSTNNGSIYVQGGRQVNPNLLTRR